MENKVVTTEINPDIFLAPLAEGEKLRRRWHTPVLRVFKMSDTKGDPELENDDGLGYGS